MIYLASPYSSKFKDEEHKRYLETMRYVSVLMNKGFHIFSPIVHCHPIALSYGLPTDYTFWQSYDEAMIKACQEFWILKLYGWENSKGVLAETKYAQSLDKPIFYVEVE